VEALVRFKNHSLARIIDNHLEAPKNFAAYYSIVTFTLYFSVELQHNWRLLHYESPQLYGFNLPKQATFFAA